MADSRIARVKTCKQCGIEYQWISGERGDLRGSCSLVCRKAREAERQAAKRAEGYRAPSRFPKRSRPPTPCQECGTPTTRPRFCCAPCSWRARDRRNGVRTLEEVNAERAANAIRSECPECKQMFRPTRFGNHPNGPQVFCSRACLYAEGKRTALVKAEVATYRRWALIAARGKRKPRHKTCLSCGVEVPKGKQRCDPCRDERALASKQAAKFSDANRAARRAAKARRRAIERGREAERFDPFEIFERDGWRCHLCRRSTPVKLRGTYAPNAPELDHIVPLAKGGKHTRANTACACRACNGAKSDRILGQPSLLALVA